MTDKPRFFNERVKSCLLHILLYILMSFVLSYVYFGWAFNLLHHLVFIPIFILSVIFGLLAFGHLMNFAQYLRDFKRGVV